MSLLRIIVLACILAGHAARAETLDDHAPWWEAFDHPGLSAVIAQGLDAHPDPVSTTARLQAAREGIREARSAGRPSGSVTAGYRMGREKSLKTAGLEEDIDSLAASARLSWELDVFRRVASGVDAATAREGMRLADVQAVQLALSMDIATAFFELAFQEEQCALMSESVADACAILERAERRAAAGLESATVVNEARALQQQMEHRWMDADIARKQTLIRFRSLVGDRDPAAMPDALSAFVLPAAPDLHDAERHLRRPDVVRAHQAWLALQGDARQAARSRLPTLALVVSAAGEGDDANPNDWEAWAGPVISVPFWKPKRAAKARSARAEAEAAERDLESVSLRAVQEIDSAWTRRKDAESMIFHMEERWKSVRAVAESLERKRSAGLVQDSEWRQSRMRMNEAAVARARWQAAGLHAHLALLNALGG